MIFFLKKFYILTVLDLNGIRVKMKTLLLKPDLIIFVQPLSIWVSALYKNKVKNIYILSRISKFLTNFVKSCFSEELFVCSNGVNWKNDWECYLNGWRWVEVLLKWKEMYIIFEGQWGVDKVIFLVDISWWELGWVG